MMPEVREVGVVIVGVEGPPTKLQTPLPTEGFDAFMVAVPGEAHTVCGDPAFAVLGDGFTVMTISLLAEQVPLVIVQRSVRVPVVVMPVTVVVGDPGVVIVAVPLTNDQTPVPEVGVLAAMVALPGLWQIV